MPTRTRRRVDINNATAEEIERACGIDGVLAERIVRYRDDHGPFTSREDIDQVPGFAEVRTDEVLSVVDLPSRRGGRGTRAGTTKRQLSTGTRASGPRQSGRRDASHAVPPPAGRSRTRSRSAEPTNDHDAIRAWVEERGGWPACVRGTGDRGDIGMIRIDFPGFSGEDSLQRIEWDQWFEQFDENQLAFLYREMRHSDGELDRFNKLVKRSRPATRRRAQEPTKKSGASATR